MGGTRGHGVRLLCSRKDGIVALLVRRRTVRTQPVLRLALLLHGHSGLNKNYAAAHSLCLVAGFGHGSLGVRRPFVND